QLLARFDREAQDLGDCALVNARVAQDRFEIGIQHGDVLFELCELVDADAQHVGDASQDGEARQRLTALEAAQVRCRDACLFGKVIEGHILLVAQLSDRRANPLALYHWPLNHTCNSSPRTQVYTQTTPVPDSEWKRPSPTETIQ